MKRNNQTRKQTKIVLYKGGNERIDALLNEHWPEDRFYFVNGPRGRKPIFAETEDEAYEIYFDRYSGEDK